MKRWTRTNWLTAAALVLSLPVLPAQGQSPSVSDLTTGPVDYCRMAKALGEPCRGLTRGIRVGGAAVRDSEDRTEAASAALRVEFELGSAELTGEARRVLTLLSEIINNSPAPKWVIEGHTDARGGDAFNLALSERRAQSAIAFLVDAHGVNAGRLEARGLGKRRPLLAADPLNGRNRRVEVVKTAGN